MERPRGPALEPNVKGDLAGEAGNPEEMEPNRSARVMVLIREDTFPDRGFDVQLLAELAL